jgi:predicted RNase H-like nuclease (RuvC/YqgF family)
MSGRDLQRALAFYVLKQAAEKAAETVSRQWDAKQTEWIARQTENIKRWQQQYESNVERIAKLDLNIEKLTDRLARTRNHERAIEIKGWITESQQKMDRLESRNRELEEKVRDVERKLTQGGNTPFCYRDSLNGKPRYNPRSAVQSTNIPLLLICSELTFPSGRGRRKR